MAGEQGSVAEVVDELIVERLRDLEWPAPPPGLRERSLEEFERLLEEAHVDADAPAAARER